MTTYRKQKISNSDESGVAAIFVVITLMTVLALISIGFSQLMNREVRQSLDRQLSLEAYYAAESGVNDANNYLTNGGSSFSSCTPPSSGTDFVDKGNISGDNLAKYTCVVVDVSPKELDYSLKQGESISIKLDLATLAALHFGWENQSYSGTPKAMSTSAGTVPLGTLLREDQVGTDSTGLLRIGIYPVSASAATSADTNATLAGASRNYFLYPNGGSGSEGAVNYADTTKNGTYVSGNCNSTNYPNLPFGQATQRFCNSAITNLSGAGTSYYVKLTALYAPLGVSIEASDSSNTALKIPNTEGIIDVTGSGNDVIKRVRALRPLGQNFDYPSYGLQSMQAVCKLFRVDVVAQGLYGDTRPDPSAPNNDGVCATPFNSNGPTEGGGLGSIGDIPCPPGKIGNYPNCVDPPPPPPPPPPPQPSCNVDVSGSRNGSSVTVSAQAGGCGYYFNNLVGWNGGGTWTANEPPGWQFCQQGGTDPWGFYAQSCVTP